MAVFFIAALLVSAVAVMSYLTHAWFGCQSSNMGQMPPYYRKLMDRFERERETESLKASSKTPDNAYPDETVK
ncbi:hypothetical protein [Spirosoma sp.]|uniref:hypothetical protein n=1 Tax=Spirosoma sp. TaxID=1899569 RepID=UPI003B3AEA4D